MQKTAKILITAAFALGFGTLANAQSASISANATVISEIAVTSVSNLNFGTVVVGQKKYINQMNGSSTVSTGTAIGTSSRGEFTVAAQAGTDVTISLILPTSLIGSPSGSLPILFGRNITEFDGDYFDPAIFSIEHPEDFGDYINPSSPSRRYPSFPTFDIGGGINGVRVVIGGQVDATNATAGTYAGTITLSATYN